MVGRMILPYFFFLSQTSSLKLVPLPVLQQLQPSAPIVTCITALLCSKISCPDHGVPAAWSCRVGISHCLRLKLAPLAEMSVPLSLTLACFSSSLSASGSN